MRTVGQSSIYTISRHYASLIKIDRLPEVTQLVLNFLHSLDKKDFHRPKPPTHLSPTKENLIAYLDELGHAYEEWVAEKLIVFYADLLESDETLWRKK